MRGMDIGIIPYDDFFEDDGESVSDELEKGTFHVEPEWEPSSNRLKGYFLNDELDGQF